MHKHNAHRRHRSIHLMANSKHKNPDYYPNNQTNIQSYNQVSNRHHNKHDSILSIAKTYYQQGNIQQAVQYLEEYLIYENNNTQALYLAGICYLHLQQPNQTILKLQSIRNNQRNGQNMYLLLAMAYDRVGQFQKSFQIISQSIKKYPKFHEGYCYRGKLYLRLKEYQLAEKDLFLSLKLNSKSFICRVALGDCYLEQHSHEAALKMFEDSLLYIQKHQQNVWNVQLKQGICLYYLQRFENVIYILQKIPGKERNSDSFYYLGRSYLKLNQSSQAILNLEYCIRVQSNKILMQKAFKTLIELFLSDYQFYETLNIIKLADIANIQCKYWKQMVQGCMLIIKGHYIDGHKMIVQIYQIIKQKRTLSNHEQVKYNSKKQNKKAKKELSEQQQQFSNQFLDLQKKIKNKNKNTKQTIITTERSNQKQKQKLKISERNDFHSKRQRFFNNSPQRKSYSLKHVKKINLTSQARNRTIFKTICSPSQQKSTFGFGSRNPKKTFIKIRNLMMKSNNNNNHTKVKLLKQNEKSIFSDQESLLLMPILLKFKAYSQFFMNNYLRSLDTYQQYESFMWNVYGQQITNEIYYNKSICQGYLLYQTEMYQQSIGKFQKAIEWYYDNNNLLPVQTVLCKIALLQKIVLPEFFHTQKQIQMGYKNLEAILDINTTYQKQLQNHHLTHYYLAIMYILTQKYDDAQEELEQTLKIAQQCSWKYLYIKGIVELILGNYYSAIKQFTAGLILDQNSDLYLGRAIGFLLEGTQRKQNQNKPSTNKIKKSIQLFNKKQNLNNNGKRVQQKEELKKSVSSDIYIENSFQDLQKFIEQQSDQDKISLWVSKLLFYNCAYDQALKALQKVQHKCPQLTDLEIWLKLYQGQFQQCGQIGALIISAFEGELISQTFESEILIKQDKLILTTLEQEGIEHSYYKWLIVLHLFKKQKYQLLTKYLQKIIFEGNKQEELIEAKYNLALVYLKLGDQTRFISILESIKQTFKGYQELIIKINKLINFQLEQDQCVQDLHQQLPSSQLHRLSQFLPYLRINVQGKLISKFFIKYSIPFPQFPKPYILLKISEKFLSDQLDIKNIEKKIDAPWIKKNKQKIQFTSEIIQAFTDFLKQTQQVDLKSQKDLSF